MNSLINYGNFYLLVYVSVESAGTNTATVDIFPYYEDSRITRKSEAVAKIKQQPFY